MKRNENYLEAAFKMFLAGTDKEKVLTYLEEQAELNSVLPVKCWRENKNIPLPTYAIDGDACCDLYAQAIEYDGGRDRWIVHTGLHIALDKDYECQIRPRSNLTKTELYISNTPCTIDEPYRGEIIVIFKARTNSEIFNAIDTLYIAVTDIKQTINDEKLLHNENCPLFRFTDSYNKMFKQTKFPYKVGERIAQLIIYKRPKIEWQEVDNLEELGETERGNGGFGHTGK